MLPEIDAEFLSGRISFVLQNSGRSPGRLAHKLGFDPRAVKNWFSGKNAPRATELLVLMSEIKELEAEIMQLVENIRKP